MSAIPIGMPGWPDLACSTASAARKRMALARSRRLGVGMAGQDSKGMGSATRTGRDGYFPPNPPRLSRASGMAVGSAVGVHLGHDLLQARLFEIGLVQDRDFIG